MVWLKTVTYVKISPKMVNPRDIAGKRRKRRRIVKRHWDGESRRQVRGERVNEIKEGGLLNVYVVADWRVIGAGLRGQHGVTWCSALTGLPAACGWGLGRGGGGGGRVHLFPLDEWLLSSIRQQQGVVEQGWDRMKAWISSVTVQWKGITDTDAPLSDRGP